MSHSAAVSPGWKTLPRAPRARDEAPAKKTSRYELVLKIGSGGTASVYIGRVSGSAGFSRLVAVKRAHPHLMHDASAQKMLVTEARLASRLNHANVVSVQDVEHTEDELLLVMDYVEGASLAELIEAGARTGNSVPARIAVRVCLDACAGLTAVHELEGDDGRPVGFLHRDVSPHNILVGVDGTTRITDFGLARRLSGRLSLAPGCLQGKLAYLAPEILDHGSFSVQSDLFAMGVVLWEALAQKRLFRGDSEADTLRKVGLTEAPRLSEVARGLGDHLDGVVIRSLEKAPTRRYGTVREFAAALEAIAGRHDLVATSAEVSGYVRQVVGESLKKRREVIRGFDGKAGDHVPLTATQTASIAFPRVISINTASSPARETTESYSRAVKLPEELLRLRGNPMVDETTADMTPLPESGPSDSAPRPSGSGLFQATEESITDVVVIPFLGAMPAPSNEATPAPEPVVVPAPAVMIEEEMVTEPILRPPQPSGSETAAVVEEPLERPVSPGSREDPTGRWTTVRRAPGMGMTVVVLALLVAVGALVVCLVVPAGDETATGTATAIATATAMTTATATPMTTATATPIATAAATANLTVDSLPTVNENQGKIVKPAGRRSAIRRPDPVDVPAEAPKSDKPRPPPNPYM